METFERKRLIYADEFKKFIHENPRVIESFLRIEKKIEDSSSVMIGDTFKDENLEATVCYEHSEKGLHYFRVRIKDQDFFVKTTPGINLVYEGGGDGAEEFESLRRIKETISAQEGVRVIDFQLGYQDNERSYFVSKFQEGEMFRDVLRRLREQVNNNQEARQKYDALMSRYQKIKKILGSQDSVSLPTYLDIHEENIIYDEKTDTMYLFDIFLSTRESIK